MAGGYSITITAVDKATTTVDAINKRFELMNKRIALAKAPFDQMEQSFSKFTKVTGLARIATGFGDVARQGTEAFRSMLRVVEPLAAITGAASVAGLYRLASAWAKFGTELGQQASRAGLSADKLLALQGAARMAGVDAGTLTTGLTTLNDNLRNAAFGAAPKFISALQAIGLKYDDIRKLSPDDALKVIADRLAKVKEPADFAAYSTALFSGAADGMRPILLRGSKGITDLTDDAARLGRQLGEQGVRDANAFNAAQGRLEIATKGVANALGDKLGVALTPLLNQFAEWLGTSPQVTAGLNAAGTAAEHFAAWLISVDWKAVGDGIATIWHDVDGVATALGGWERAGELVLGFFVARWLVQMLAPFATISKLLLQLPIDAAKAAAAANLSLGGVIAKVGATGAVLAAGYAAWQGLDWLQDKTAPKEDGLANLVHNMEFDMNPLHWTRSYHADKGAAGGADSGGTANLPAGAALQNARSMAGVYKELGLTREGAAAMLGASMGESGNNPDPAHNNEGRGAFQWSPSRLKDIEAFYHKKFSDMSAAEQARAAIHEIDTKPEFASLRTGLRTSHDLAGLNAGVTRIFEAPADIPGQTAARMPMARGALRQIQIDQQNAPSGEPVAAPSPAPNGTAGPPGASGQVNMNVKVDGAAQVTTTSTGGVHVEVRNPAMAY